MPRQLVPMMNQQEALSAAITLTGEILEILEEGEFERVEELEAQRKIYIEQAFADSIEHVDRIKAQHLQSLNQQVVEKLNLFKQSVILQQKRIRIASQATRAYLSNDSYPK
jgi:hypothetical protein